MTKEEFNKALKEFKEALKSDKMEYRPKGDGEYDYLISLLTGYYDKWVTKMPYNKDSMYNSVQIYDRIRQMKKYNKQQAKNRTDWVISEWNSINGMIKNLFNETSNFLGLGNIDWKALG